MNDYNSLHPFTLLLCRTETVCGVITIYTDVSFRSKLPGSVLRSLRHFSMVTDSGMFVYLVQWLRLLHCFTMRFLRQITSYSLLGESGDKPQSVNHYTDLVTRRESGQKVQFSTHC